MKVMKLGVWNKGLAKGLKTFVKETYDEREVLEKKCKKLRKT